MKKRCYCLHRWFCCFCDLPNVMNAYPKEQLTGHPWSHRFPSWPHLRHSQKRQDGEAPGSVPEASTAQTSGRRYWAPPEGTGKSKQNKQHGLKNAVCVWVFFFFFKIGCLAWPPILTIKMIPRTANQRRTVDAGFHSNFTQLYGVNWNAIRFIFPLEEHIRNSLQTDYTSLAYTPMLLHL